MIAKLAAFYGHSAELTNYDFPRKGGVEERLSDTA